MPAIGRQAERVHCDPSVARKSTRQTYQEQMGGYVPTPIYDGNRLRWGHLLAGPAIVERMGDCVLIPPQFCGVVDQYGNMVVRKSDGN